MLRLLEREGGFTFCHNLGQAWWCHKVQKKPTPCNFTLLCFKFQYAISHYFGHAQLCTKRLICIGRASLPFEELLLGFVCTPCNCFFVMFVVSRNQKTKSLSNEFSFCLLGCCCGYQQLVCFAPGSIAHAWWLEWRPTYFGPGAHG